MEPSGGNRSQPLANGTAAKTAQRGKTIAMGCNRLLRKCHGKEGVDGSSPSEGFKGRCKWGFLIVLVVRSGDMRSRQGRTESDAVNSWFDPLPRDGGTSYQPARRSGDVVLRQLSEPGGPGPEPHPGIRSR
jgi:hypothetical protein